MSQPLLTESNAIFSPDRVYRYRLWRRWSPGPTIHFVCLNPSTADELQNDPTVERLERRARMWDYGRLDVTNIFSIRATDPREMLRHSEPIGSGNDAAILEATRDADITVCAWGAHGAHLGRGEQVRRLLSRVTTLYALKLTSFPWHPLYLPYSLRPQVWP